MSEYVVDGGAVTINSEVGITEKSEATGVSGRGKWMSRIQIGEK